MLKGARLTDNVTRHKRHTSTWCRRTNTYLKTRLWECHHMLDSAPTKLDRSVFPVQVEIVGMKAG